MFTTQNHLLNNCFSSDLQPKQTKRNGEFVLSDNQILFTH